MLSVSATVEGLAVVVSCLMYACECCECVKVLFVSVVLGGVMGWGLEDVSRVVLVLWGAGIVVLMYIFFLCETAHRMPTCLIS